MGFLAQDRDHLGWICAVKYRTARQYVLLDYDIPRSALDRACELTPGLESPTISPLQKADWVAVRAMVPRRDTNAVMDDLWTIGARGILVTDIHACRL